MRSVVFLLLIVFCFSYQANSQVVSTKNWTLIHERTADWCPYCGTWGWNLKSQMLDKFANDNVIFMAVHHSGGLNNATATAFGANFPGAGQPIFYVDGVDINATSTNIMQKLDETQLEVDFKASVGALAGVGINANLSQTEKVLTVDAKVEFLSDVEGGDYYFGLYLLEDVMHSQASRNGLQLHKFVLRQSLLNSVFGTPLQKGAVAKGTTFNISATATDIASDREKYKVVGIIWNKVNNKYIFFNANQVNPGIPAGTAQIDEASFSVYQSESGNIIVEEAFNQNLDNTYITVSDMAGKILVRQNVSPADTGGRMTIDGIFLPGVHIVTIFQGTQKRSKKVLIQ